MLFGIPNAVDPVTPFHGAGALPAEVTNEDEPVTCWRALLPAINIPGAATLLQETHGTAPLHDSNDQALFPDLVAYTASAPARLPLYVELVGDLKKESAPPFDAESYLRLRRYADAQLKQQPLRSFFICFVAGRTSIEFFKLSRRVYGAPAIQCTQPLPLAGSGGALLLQLLRAPASTRGTTLPPPVPPIPGVGQIVLSAQLGRGCSAVAYKGDDKSEAGSQEYVVKWYSNEGDAAAEASYLKLLKTDLAGDSCIPSYIFSTDQLVVLSPVATKLSLFDPLVPVVDSMLSCTPSSDTLQSLMRTG